MSAVSRSKDESQVSHLATHSSASDSSVFAILALPIHCIPPLASLHDDNNTDYQLSYQTIWHCQMQIRKHLWAPSVQCYDLNFSIFNKQSMEWRQAKRGLNYVWNNECKLFVCFSDERADILTWMNYQFSLSRNNKIVTAICKIRQGFYQLN